MNFEKLLDTARIDFTDCIIEQDSGTRLSHNFDINPSEFLSFSKSDIKDKSKKGLVNALSNAKRAIDSQIDKIFMSFGYTPKNFPKHLIKFIDFFTDATTNKDAPIKLRIINAFGMAPSGLVSQVRTLRNKLEHDFSVPEYSEVKQSIEIAELFIAATDKKLMDFWGFEITDMKHKEKAEEGKLSGIYISEDISSPALNVRYKSPFSDEDIRIIIKPEDPAHPILMRMCISHDQFEEFQDSLIALLKFCGQKIPEHKVCAIPI
ncbi:hypothetical protein M3P05_20520 [Sansalvadorimonas sp. 2012CJ34-2]|uniref:Uncharacterized protein n=1 Tax=Parendozoicomonas callyspongiae TaxID=2942213 RepID=A0ABT0PLP4_9GAMM|nr:hypothetical protein [Sansalvadorimonas sp. 2012CJ34-2]MCL6272304.1 hypothetical protein [Sansalvadorimonas sp. 2012CJ34-2]